MSSYEEAWLTGPQSTNFYTRTYRPEGPLKAAVVFVHGFIEHIARYEHVLPVWTARGIAVFAFDLRGFGRTALGEKDKRSKDSAYGKTSWREQMEDVEWAVRHTQEAFKEGNVPVFLYGHSMGGGLALAFATRSSAPPTQEAVGLLSGVIGSSPLVIQTKPASKVARWIGGKASTLSPNMNIPAEVKPQALSHDPEVGKAFMKDPFVKQTGSLRGISDMLDGGEQLLAKDYERWPPGLPTAAKLLIVHGTEDQVTSCKSSKEFLDKVPAEDKTFIPFEGAYHEVHNETQDMREPFIEACISWVERHLEQKLVASRL
ncbi:alpha beta-hydrolase [Coniophora puteana RWD-64-598 SS2]|uniref:Alpha beta-hydrolase n=1 Tax=Coniophora puteana (strain RWD-64-598) TaxID=741705 RepID=A0A5M3MNS1_CONPW|nr:alpha beta-hydrolase [Coniophora puteana RWD-64-598 SS2]EIW80281.1 alpha beta-hydrolase [Coniophora puteana RWD-64-598 SS2]